MRRLLLLLLVPLCAPLSVVEVSDGVRGCADVLRPGSCVSVTLDYLHSVEQTRVEETYDVCGGGIWLRKMEWKSFGAGLPSEYDYYANGAYVKDTDIDVGKTLSYWFLPLNRVEIRVNGRLVFEGPEEPSRVNVRVRRMLVAMWLASKVMCQPLVS